MAATALLFQLLNGLAAASSLFLVSAGLSLIFGVTRIVNFAHGAFYMLGVYVAYTIATAIGGGPGFWIALPLAGLAVALLGALAEILLLRRVYRAPDLLQLLATFALVLVLDDGVLWAWGPDDLLGPRAPGLSQAVPVLGRHFPSYDLFLVLAGPLVLGLLWFALKRTRWGILVRAATQDRDMVAALGVDEARLFTGVFALGSFLAGLGGALQLPREPAHLGLDLSTIGDAFVVVVVGGLGSLPGAYVAALLVAEVKAICTGLGTVAAFDVTIAFSKLTLVAEFIVMAVVLSIRPWGLMGRAPPPGRGSAAPAWPLEPASRGQAWLGAAVLVALVALPAVARDAPYVTILAIDMLTAALYAASLHFIAGTGAMHSFGHAAYFGFGAYGAALLALRAGLPMEAAVPAGALVALLGAAFIGWFCVRLSGIYFAMISLAFAQIAWSIAYEWDAVTGGSNGLTGVWPAPWLADKRVYFEATLAAAAIGVVGLRRLVFSPFGYAVRAVRDSPLRAAALGFDVRRVQWIAFCCAGCMAGLAGSLFAFSKGSISPDVMSVGKSVDGLVMVLLGGVQSLVGPLLGAAAFTGLQDMAARATDYWRALVGATLLALILVVPEGLAGVIDRVLRRARGMEPGR